MDTQIGAMVAHPGATEANPVAVEFTLVFKGTISRDFLPLFFIYKNLALGHCFTLKKLPIYSNSKLTWQCQ